MAKVRGDADGGLSKSRAKDSKEGTWTRAKWEPEHLRDWSSGSLGTAELSSAAELLQPSDSSRHSEDQRLNQPS